MSACTATGSIRPSRSPRRWPRRRRACWSPPPRCATPATPIRRSAWESAEARVGAPHLPSPAIRAAVASPFDYAAQTRAFIVTDVFGGDIAQLAAAYRALFIAAGGGALGLFTAIRRLQAVHARIAPELEEAGIPLYAQHVDAMGNATLVDIFRTEEESCLLGTDAMRDGVDVPGRALRLVVFEKVPWPRPDILHRERRIHLSDGDPKGYDDRIARLRLRQAFGRLIRRATDRGVFVLLDRQTPSRLLSAFPAGVAIRRVGLAEAVRTDARLPGRVAARLNCPGRLDQVPARCNTEYRQCARARRWTRPRHWFSPWSWWPRRTAA